jgi:predicted nucleic acid-binding protein
MAGSSRYIVPDTCALAAILFQEQYSSNAAPLLTAIRNETIEAVAPSIGLAEFLNVARKRIANPQVPLSPGQVDAVVQDFLSLPITWWDVQEADTGATLRCWREYWNHGVGTWDAYFLILAQDFDAELWTTDGPFFNAACARHAKTFDLRDAPFS